MLSKEGQNHYLWDLYSRSMLKKIMNPLYAGNLDTKIYSDSRLGIKYQIDFKYKEEEKIFAFYNYRVSGPTYMIAILETLGSLIDGKETKSITADDIFSKMEIYEASIVYGDEEMKGYMQKIAPYVNHVLESVYEKISDIVPENFVTPDGLTNVDTNDGPVEGFETLSKENQLMHIETVIEKDIAPFVALDGGGIEIKDLTKSLVLLIQYKGNCTSCYAASSTTLQAITQILKAKIYPTIEVLPVMS